MREPKEEGPSVARYTMTCPLSLPRMHRIVVLLSGPGATGEEAGICSISSNSASQPLREYPGHRVIHAFLCEPFEQGGDLQGILID